METRIEESIFNRQLGEVLAELRERAGLRQVDVAQALGVSVRSIMRLESGEVMLRPALQVELARLYHVAPEIITRIALRRYENRMQELQELEAYMRAMHGRDETDSLTQPSVNRDFTRTGLLQKILP